MLPRSPLFAIPALALWLGACQPRTSAEDLLLARRDPTCAFAPRSTLLDDSVEKTLHQAGEGVGRVSAIAPAQRHTERLTSDGYFVRKTSSTLLMVLAALGIGALGAALLLSLWSRRPTARWAERLGETLAREIDKVRALGQAGDAFMRHLVQRFDEALTVASKKAQRLVARALPLERRDSATAIAHLDSIHGQLETLVARVERLHLQILAWQERAHREEDEALAAQIAQTLDDLAAAARDIDGAAAPARGVDVAPTAGTRGPA